MSESVSAVATVSDAVEAVANAPETISRIFDMAERAVYGTGYTIAFVIVFPVALLCTAIPKRNCLVQGFLDGTTAAQCRAQALVR